MIFSGIEAKLHKDSIFDVKTYDFKGFRPDFDRNTKKIRGGDRRKFQDFPKQKAGPQMNPDTRAHPTPPTRIPPRNP